MDLLFAIAVVFGLFALLGGAALGFGVDSRDGFGDAGRLTPDWR